jgi:tetratricopeptide (TPR) repeat protein
MLHRAQLLSLLFSLCTLAAAQTVITHPESTNLRTVSGAVYTMQNSPVRNARVELRELSTGRVLTSTYTQSNGKFEFNNIPDSNYEVVATSGIIQSSERLTNSKTNNYVELRLSAASQDNRANSRVSVAALRVPDKARKEFERAAEAYDKHKPLEKITQHLTRALEIYPQYAQALTLKAVLLMNEANFPEAKSLFQQSIDSDPSYAIPYVALASIMTHEQRFDDALRTLDRAVPLAPNMWQIYFEMGKALLAKGDFERSLRNLTRAESLNSQKYGTLNLVKAHALLGLKNYNAAINELQQFLESEPSGPDSERARNVLRQAQAFASTTTAASR